MSTRGDEHARAGVIASNGRNPASSREPPAQERAEQAEERLGEVEDPRALVDEHEAEGEEPVDQASAETDDDVGEELSSYASWRRSADAGEEHRPQQVVAVEQARPTGPRSGPRPSRGSRPGRCSRARSSACCSTMTTVSPSSSHEALHGLHEPLDDDRREAERQLVDHQQLGPGHQRPGDGQLLLLAARQRARRAGRRARRSTGSSR